MRTAFRGSVFHCLADPGEHDDEQAIVWFEDGLLVVEDGMIEALGEADALMNSLSDDTQVEDYSGKLIVPGLIDCHVHYPQIDVIASYGEELLDWLNRYAYPREMRFADEDYAREVAAVFVDELIRKYFIGIQAHNPFIAAFGESAVLLATVAKPVLMVNFIGVLASYRQSGVVAARIYDDDFVGNLGRLTKAVADNSFFVLANDKD